MVADVYIETNVPGPKFILDFLRITEMVRLIAILNMMISYYLVLLFEKRAKYSYYMQKYSC